MPTCEYCNKSFARQKTMDVHMCEPKRRWSQKDNKVHVLAFEIFRRFYEINFANQKPKQFTNNNQPNIGSGLTKSKRWFRIARYSRYVNFMKFILPLMA